MEHKWYAERGIPIEELRDRNMDEAEKKEVRKNGFKRKNKLKAYSSAVQGLKTRIPRDFGQFRS